jgi:nucleoside-diphosphate-sugar epimerase
MQTTMLAPDTLVTGSAGHLGHALMLELPSHGYTPIGIDVKSSEFTTLVGSFADRAFVTSIFAVYSSIRYILHTGTLHKPHVNSHTKSDFVQTNIQGTLNLLEECPDSAVFIFTSTTSTFGKALRSSSGNVMWITENIVPIPKNIYGVTKVAAEDLCHLVQEQRGLPVLVLKVSRFFPELDDDPNQDIPDVNLKVCELLYRRVDLADVVTAHVAALERAGQIRWGKYIISAPTPFAKDDIKNGHEDPMAVLQRIRPREASVLKKLGWRMPRLDRVYDSSKAVSELGWKPVYTFESVVGFIDQGKEWRSELAIRVGKRGYHDFPTGVYTT